MRASILPRIFAWSCHSVPARGCAEQRDPAAKFIPGFRAFQIPAVPNAPFTARIVVTWDQPLASGGTLSRKYYTMVARDSKGRVHRETRDLFLPIPRQSRRCRV